MRKQKTENRKQNRAHGFILFAVLCSLFTAEVFAAKESGRTKRQTMPSAQTKQENAPKKKKSFWKKAGKVLVTAAAVATGVYFIAKAANKQSVTAQVERINRTRIESATLSGVTPLGVPYRARSQISDAVIAEIDRAWAYNLRTAAYFGYTERIEPRYYELILLPEELKSRETRTPSLALPVNCKTAVRSDYCGSVYDNGLFKANKQGLFDPSGKVVNKYIHFITVAEEVRTETFNQPVGRYTVIIPKEETPANLALVCYAARFGWEHFALRFNDINKYNETIGLGFDFHPIIPIPNEPDPCNAVR